jgi:heat shock protein HslJ
MKRHLMLPALFAALTLAACSTSHPPPPPGPGTTEPPPVRPAPPPPRPTPSEAKSLTGTRWHLVRLDGHDVIDGSKASLVISREGRMGGNTSCNTMFGHVTIDGNTIAFGQMGSTKMACVQDGVMDQERQYFAALKRAATWRVEGDRLYLANRARKDVLMYEAE